MSAARVGRRKVRRSKVIRKARKAGQSGLPMRVMAPGRRAIRRGRALAKDPEVRRKAKRAAIITASTLGGPAGLAIATAATSPKVQAKARQLAARAKRRR